ncbi:MAG: tRNA (adenosine(37)-N6)-threonylcarbamoyltransferase complex transferase subunit TsaD [Halothiobacillaceae bacterium]|nr:tRNA (adenosine(37)-N6)-threonylcarbamoyltransferase complex transferase subunit TsaD [Halothiobacillaceae bacterium]
MIVLGIETSCDETACALYSDERGLIGDRVLTQAVHAEYGGVVPELASRDHVRYLLPMVDGLLRDCGVPREEIGGVAYTAGPGLLGALLVGSAFGAGLAFALDVSAIEVHHMEGHVLAPMLDDASIKPPFVALLVSGGHTMLVAVPEIGRYEVLGESLDDAVGEVFDKVAKQMGLGYPGGAALAKLAESGRAPTHAGVQAGVPPFPRPMTDRPGLEFSFSGLKTRAMQILRQVEAGDAPEQGRADVARALQEAMVDTLVIKCVRALEQVGMRNVVVAGGVGANLYLRERLSATLEQRGGRAYFPRQAFCTDNAAMIAYAGWLRLKAGQGQRVSGFAARARWPLDQLSPLV